ncbi:MAG: DUF5518 domain-containing protein [Methanomicrobiales archaeon]|nr:DUF5518 domain-containing protein [Methanomicrobiales archaeon]
MGKQTFWLAAAVGAIVMFLLSILPVLGPIIGGFVAGLIARGNPKNGAKVGGVAGIIGGLIVASVLAAGYLGLAGIFNRALVEILGQAGFSSTLWIISIVLYHALLGLMGGAIGAALARE